MSDLTVDFLIQIEKARKEFAERQGVDMPPEVQVWKDGAPWVLAYIASAPEGSDGDPTGLAMWAAERLIRGVGADTVVFSADAYTIHLDLEELEKIERGDLNDHWENDGDLKKHIREAVVFFKVDQNGSTDSAFIEYTKEGNEVVWGDLYVYRWSLVEGMRLVRYEGKGVPDVPDDTVQQQQGFVVEVLQDSMRSASFLQVMEASGKPPEMWGVTSEEAQAFATAIAMKEVIGAGVHVALGQLVGSNTAEMVLEKLKMITGSDGDDLQIVDVRPKDE